MKTMNSNLKLIRVKRGLWNVIGPNGKIIFTGTKREIENAMRSQN